MSDKITSYLTLGGLWNPELADHGAVCRLLIDAREELSTLRAERDHYKKQSADRLIGLCKCGIERDALQARIDAAGLVLDGEAVRSNVIHQLISA